MSETLDQFFKLLLFINSKYAPLSSRSYNLTYLSRLSLISDEIRAKTVASICSDGIPNILSALEIGRISPSLHKKLTTIVNNINAEFGSLAEQR